MEGWHDVGGQDDLFSGGQCRGIVIDGLKVGLFLVDGAIHAIDDLCSHGNALLSDGELEGHEIECPLHAGLFDIRSGKALCAPLTRDVRRHQVRVMAGRVLVQVAA
ncbi:non-heme iron oxygenase ferredoxin subunit [Novosphingobium rosa]|uniref:non-heme iron oxygenase ferredoxin subunit n=1 Tax=Novosphingobium rosa TaxID=76978 RepID=UPI00082A29B2|nr:non-heme iron oxygenase ferredoxin subunit [Novosphingobium rosa]